METKASEEEKSQGLDLADYLLKIPYKTTQHKGTINQPIPQPIPCSPQISVHPKPIFTNINSFKKTPTEDWSNEIKELESFFNSASIPAQINFSEGIIDNVHKFIYAHLEYSKAQNGNKTYLPYLERLIKLRSLLLLYIWILIYYMII